MLQELLDDLRGGRPDAERLRPAGFSATDQTINLVRRQMGQDGLALTRLAGAVVDGDRLMLVSEQFDGARAAPDPQRLADQTVRCGVVAALEDHVAIAMEGGLLPDRQVIRRPRQGPQRRPFDLLELLDGVLLGGAMLALAGRLDAPGAELGIELVERSG